MRTFTSEASNLASNPWFVIIASVSSIAGFFWYIQDQIKQNPPILSVVYLTLSIILLLAGIFYSLKIRSENATLRKIAYTFNEINHIYKTALKDMFGENEPTYNPEDLLEEEEKVLRSVCQRIENIFIQVIGRECLVTVKLLLNEKDGKYYAHTYVRSQEMCTRDNDGRKKYEVGTSANTAFDTALQKRSHGYPPHYFSPDLLKEKEYSNERQHYNRHYRSTIVVPIMGNNKGHEGTEREFDRIGFLCIDTPSTYRLNDGYHLQMISSLADQMYNFMSLMRGKYTLRVG